MQGLLVDNSPVVRRFGREMLGCRAALSVWRQAVRQIYQGKAKCRAQKSQAHGRFALVALARSLTTRGGPHIVRVTDALGSFAMGADPISCHLFSRDFPIVV